MFHIIVANELKSDKHLCAFAKSQMKEGKTDLQRWIMNHRNTKARQDMIHTAWSIDNSDFELDRQK